MLRVQGARRTAMQEASFSGRTLLGQDEALLAFECTLAAQVMPSCTIRKIWWRHVVT